MPVRRGVALLLAGVVGVAGVVAGAPPAGAEGESVVVELPSELPVGGLGQPLVGVVRNEGSTNHQRVTLEVTVQGAASLRPEHVVLELRSLVDDGRFERVPFTGSGTLQTRLAPGGLPLPAGQGARLLLRIGAAEGAPVGPVDVRLVLRTVDADGSPGAALGGDRQTVDLVPLQDPVVRLAGTDRFRTATAVSSTGWVADGARSAVLARADVFADALAATPLAAAKGGPLLLTGGDRLDAATATELQQVLPPGAKVFLVGGVAALAERVADDVRGLGFVAERLAGGDRYATAVAVASSGLGDPSTLLLSTGDRHPDALAAGAAAGHVGGAVLLTEGSRVPAATAEYLARRSNAVRYAVGGPAAAADPSARAVAGADRYATAVRVAETFFGEGPRAVGLASGVSFADALSGGADAATRHAPLLLSDGSSLPEVTAGYLRRTSSVSAVALYGGSAAVSDAVAAAARQALS